MPKLTSLLLAVLLICLTLNFCTKNNTPNAIDISGTYSDTIRIVYVSGRIVDTVIVKNVIKINDTTFRMSRFFGFGFVCDSANLLLKPDFSISVFPTGADKSACVVFINNNPGPFEGSGFFDPVQQYLYLHHSIMYWYDTFNRIPGVDFKVMDISSSGIPSSNCYGSCGTERMKKQ